MLREEILLAAQRLVAEKGYAAMSMDELAAQVGISKPTLYSFFATKEELVVAAMLRAMQRLLVLIETDQAERTPLQRLTLILRTAMQQQIDECGTLPRSWTPDLSQLLNDHQEAISCLHRLDAEVVSLIHAGIQQGEIDPDLDPATVVWTVYALVGVPYLVQFSAGGAPDLAAATNTLALIFERGLRNEGR